MNGICYVFRALLVVVGLIVPLAAQALVITVNGTDHDVIHFPAGQSFLDNIDALTDPASAPWWGQPTDAATGAEAFAAAYRAAHPGGFDNLPGFEVLLFAYETSGSGTTGNPQVVALDDGGGIVLGSYGRTTSAPNAYYAHVSTGPAAVPEIDGNALAKALFLLFTLWLWLQVRRDRRLAGHARRD